MTHLNIPPCCPNKRFVLVLVVKKKNYKYLTFCFTETGTIITKSFSVSCYQNVIIAAMVIVLV